MGLVGCSSGVCGLSLGCRWGVGLVFGGCFGDRWVGEIEGGSFPGIGLGGGLIPRFPCLLVFGLLPRGRAGIALVFGGHVADVRWVFLRSVVPFRRPVSRV